MKSIDLVIFCIYLGAVMLTGFLPSRTSDKGISRYTAGRSMKRFTIGISVMVTAFSSINFLAMPSEVYMNGLYILVALPVFFIVAVPVTKIIIPFFHSMKLVSVYEYLELRYGPRARFLAAAMFIIWRMAWMAVALYAAGKMLHIITGVPFVLVIIVSGICATLYTVTGGIRSVMKTDVLQFIVLFGAIAGGSILAVSMNAEGVQGIFGDALAGGLLQPIAPFDPSFFSFDPFIRITFWSGLAGVFVAFSARYGADQVVVQRYFTARSLKESIQGFWLNTILVVVSLVLLVFLGLALYSWSIQTGTAGKGIPPLKQMAMLFSAMPAGMFGLITAGIAAATMSSVDSGVNSCSAVWFCDIRKTVDRSNHSGKIFGLVLGFLTTGIAVLFIPLLGSHASLFAMMNKIINGVGAPLLAMLLSGMFLKNTNEEGVVLGGFLGLCFSLGSVVFIHNLALHYYAFVNFFLTALLIVVFSQLHKGSDIQSFNQYGFKFGLSKT